jgi:sugar lactone lactonase YvrE
MSLHPRCASSRLLARVCGAAVGAASLSLGASAWAEHFHVETLASFDAALLETPESIAVDSHGNALVSLSLIGEVRRVAPDGSQSTFVTLPLGAPPGTPCGPFLGGLLGITLDFDDNLYVNLASCDPASRGVWKVTPDGAASQLATLPISGLPNGIAYDRGQLYVADSTLGVIWRVGAGAPAPAEVWADDPLLKTPNPATPGPNGIQVFHDEVYVSNFTSAQILALGIGGGGDAAYVRVHASGVACDDFAFDVFGDLYCGTDPGDTLVMITPGGANRVLLTAADGLDIPTAAAFGRRWDTSFDLYVTSASYPFFPDAAGHPSLLRVDLGVLGYPRPEP